jgi:hypothetical protein
MNNPYEATADDFSKWERQAKKMSIAELDFSIKDCIRAAEAMATHPAPNKENFYRDQAATFSQEKRKRK